TKILARKQRKIKTRRPPPIYNDLHKSTLFFVLDTHHVATIFYDPSLKTSGKCTVPKSGAKTKLFTHEPKLPIGLNPPIAVLWFVKDAIPYLARAINNRCEFWNVGHKYA